MAGWSEPTNWYWSVTDSSPGTQVWQGATGQFVVLANADYVAFLAAGNTPTTIPTFVGLCSVIDSNNDGLYSSGEFFGNPQTFSISSGNVTLTNPLTELITINNPIGSGIVRNVILPQMNLFGSIPKGVPFYIQVNTSDNIGHAPGINLRYVDGTTPVTAGISGDMIMLLLSDNSTMNGTIIPVILPFVPVQTLRGGLGTNVAPNDTQIPIGQGGIPKTYAPKTVSGDVTNDDTGLFTLASTIAAGGPTGDASHVAQITYDAKGRLTAVTSVAITGTAPGGSAGGDLSGTYPNPTVAKVNGNNPIHVVDGGSGAATLTGLLVGNGTSPFTTISYTPPTTYTPTDQSGASLTFTSVDVFYERIGNDVTIYGTLTYPATADASQASFSLPVAVPNVQRAEQPGIVSNNSAVADVGIFSQINTSTCTFAKLSNAGTAITNANLSGARIRFRLTYPVT